jgi:hypothetical protein
VAQYWGLTVQYISTTGICFVCAPSTRAVWKVSSQSKYLENWSHGPDVTWKPVRGDLTARPWTVSRPWG